MPAPGPSMSTHRHNPASSFRPPRNVTWNGHRYLAMPNSVRIGPIKVNLIGYQSVRRDPRVKVLAARIRQNQAAAADVAAGEPSTRSPLPSRVHADLRASLAAKGRANILH